VQRERCTHHHSNSEKSWVSRMEDDASVRRESGLLEEKKRVSNQLKLVREQICERI